MRLICKRTVLLAAPLAVVLPLVAWWASASPGDLGRLSPYAVKYNYDALVASLEARGVPPETFTFVVLGDSRNNTAVASRVYSHATAEDPSIIFNTGDLIRGGTVEEYLENHIPLLEIADPTPVFCIPGNHERGDRRDFAAFKTLYGDTRFSFDYGQCRFVGFNASETVRISNSELAYLDRELGKPGVAYKFVFLHIPPKYFEREICTDDRRGFAWNAEELRDILDRHDVDEVFMGHIHGYASKVMDGVRYTLTAGAGAPLSQRLPDEARVFHYIAVHVSPEGVEEELVYWEPRSDTWPRKRIY